MRISDWSSDVCSSDLGHYRKLHPHGDRGLRGGRPAYSISHYRTPRAAGCHVGGSCKTLIGGSRMSQFNGSLEAVKVQYENKVCTITMERPDKNNGLEQIGRASCRDRGGQSV